MSMMVKGVMMVFFSFTLSLTEPRQPCDEYKGCSAYRFLPSSKSISLLPSLKVDSMLSTCLMSEFAPLTSSSITLAGILIFSLFGCQPGMTDKGKPHLNRTDKILDRTSFGPGLRRKSDAIGAEDIHASGMSWRRSCSSKASSFAESGHCRSESLVSAVISYPRCRLE